MYLDDRVVTRAGTNDPATLSLARRWENSEIPYGRDWIDWNLLLG